MFVKLVANFGRQLPTTVLNLVLSMIVPALTVLIVTHVVSYNFDFSKRIKRPWATGQG